MVARGKRRLPPPNWLRAFEAAARHSSFTGAAKELHVTQSAVSQQVRLLEQYVQEPLFHRHPRRLQLTDTGEAYLVTVHDAFERLAHGTDELFGQRQTERVTLRTNAAFATYWLAPRLRHFQAANPDIDVRINISIWLTETVWEAVSLEVRYGSGNWPGLRADRLTRESLFPVCAPELLDGPRALRTPADLANQRLLHVLGHFEGWPRWLEAAGLAELSGSGEMQCDSSVVALEYAACGGGVAIGHHSLVEPLMAVGRLVAPFDMSVDASEAFFLVAPQSREDSTAAGALRRWMLEQATRS